MATVARTARASMRTLSKARPVARPAAFAPMSLGLSTVRFASSTAAKQTVKQNFFSGNSKFAGAAMAGGLALAFIANEGDNMVHCATEKVDWVALRAAIEALLENENAYNPGCDGAPGARGGGGDVGPMLVRLAWHCSGTYCPKMNNGGSDGGTMRFSPESDHGANAGLGHARALLEPIKKQFPSVSYADLYIFAGKVAIEEMGGPQIPFRSGRTDADGPKMPSEDSRFSPDGRLPDADKGSFDSTVAHLRDIFHRMGFSDQEIVALSGAHALGRCHTDRSGYWGPWTRAPNTFSNEYFRLLVEEKWTLKTKHNGKAWTGPKQYEDPTGELMMLPSDIALTKEPAFKSWVIKYAKDEALFFKDFSKAYQKLNELGCNTLEVKKPWYQFW